MRTLIRFFYIVRGKVVVSKLYNMNSILDYSSYINNSNYQLNKWCVGYGTRHPVKETKDFIRKYKNYE